MAKTHNLINGGSCKVEGCEKESAAKQLCYTHYKRLQRHGDVNYVSRMENGGTGLCSVEGCNRIRHAKGYCYMHYERMNISGDVGVSGLTKNEKGQGSINNQGYHCIGKNGKQHRLTHRIIAEEAVGYKLPQDVIVHHVDGNRANNEKSNLVICENHSYHMLIHRRQRAFENCGNANWMKCEICKKYDNPDNLRIIKKAKNIISYHKECNKIESQLYRNKIKEKKRIAATHTQGITP